MLCLATVAKKSRSQGCSVGRSGWRKPQNQLPADTTALLHVRSSATRAGLLFARRPLRASDDTHAVRPALMQMYLHLLSMIQLSANPAALQRARHLDRVGGAMLARARTLRDEEATHQKHEHEENQCFSE